MFWQAVHMHLCLKLNNMKYKIIVAYDGTNYQGWQQQKNKPTIAGTLEKTFLEIFKKNIKIFGASRTDANVHAHGQVATFHTDLQLSPTKIKAAWNNTLPESLEIKSVESVSANYNPHHHIVEKRYEYTFSLQRSSPFVARYQWHYRWPVNIEKLNNALSTFIGIHDFRSFCTGHDMKSTIRTIYTISVKKINDETFKIIFTGPGFLRYMIRRIVGACLEIASRPHLSIAHIKNIKDKKNPEHTLPCAPAKGLVLISITYETGF